MHTPPSSSVNRSALRRSTPAGGGSGSALRTGATHQCRGLRRPASQRRGVLPATRAWPSARNVASTSSTATGPRSPAELAARRCMRPRESSSHTPTPRPLRAMATLRRTSCHRGSGRLERVLLMGSAWGSRFLRAHCPSDGSRQEGVAVGTALQEEDHPCRKQRKRKQEKTNSQRLRVRPLRGCHDDRGPQYAVRSSATAATTPHTPALQALH